MDDEDKATMAALDKYVADGSDLSRPMEMDFFVAAPSEESAEVVAGRVRELGFATTVEASETPGGWTCNCKKVIIPSYQNVRAIEHQLDAIAREAGGYADGFGSFGNADDQRS
jgi:hypothetical protein